MFRSFVRMLTADEWDIFSLSPKWDILRHLFPATKRHVLHKCCFSIPMELSCTNFINSHLVASSSSSCHAISTDIPPRSSLETPTYRPLLPAGLQDYIPYRRRAAVCRFVLVVLPLLVHVKGSTGVHHL